jgi:hypothetical protein
MAYYEIKTNNKNAEFCLDQRIITLATQEHTIHNFEDELRIISEHTELVAAEEKIEKEKAEKEAKEAKEAQDKLDAENKVIAEAKAKEEAENAAKVAESTASSNAFDGMESPFDGMNPPGTHQQQLEQEQPPSTSTGDNNSTESVPNTRPPKPDSSTKPTIQSKNESNDIPFAVPTVQGVLTEATVSATATATNATATNINPPVLTRELSSGAQEAIAAVAQAQAQAQAQVDPEIQRLLDLDSLVSQMCEKTKCNREDAQFYLDSADQNLEAAIALYQSLVLDN